jgi:predicted TIM-barrel fold metal-dependent hydrolase
MREGGFKKEEHRPGVPTLRVQDQDIDGVDAEVIYGAAHNLGQRLPDLDILAVSLTAYNDFVAEFNQTYPGRFYGLGGVAGNNPEAAVLEVEHIAELGLPGVQLTMYGMAKPLWHPSWEPVWAAAANHRLPVAMHIGKGTTTVSRGDSGDVVLPDMDNPANAAAFICVCSMQADEALASIVLCGALDRHPTLKVVLAECEAGWIPFLLARMDDQWEENYFKWKEMITKKPSDLFRRQMYATFERDSVGPRLAGEFCPDNFMWGSDYPHESNGTWPNSRAAIEKYIGGVDAKLRQKLVHDNVAALFHIA